MKTSTKTLLLSIIYLGIFFGTCSWFFIIVCLKGFMTPKPTYLESLVALGIMCLYGNTYVLWLCRIFSWERTYHARVQLCVFLGLLFVHFILWLI